MEIRDPRDIDVLSSDEACRRLDNDPGKLSFSFPSFMHATKLTWPEMLKELQCGRLKSTRHFEDDGTEVPLINGTHMIEWMVLIGFKFPSIN